MRGCSQSSLSSLLGLGIQNCTQGMDSGWRPLASRSPLQSLPGLLALLLLQAEDGLFIPETTAGAGAGIPRQRAGWGCLSAESFSESSQCHITKQSFQELRLQRLSSPTPLPPLGEKYKKLRLSLRLPRNAQLLSERVVTSFWFPPSLHHPGLPLLQALAPFP